MADHTAVEEIRWALEWMQRHAPLMSGPGHVTDREDAAIFAKRALARLDDLPTPEAFAEALWGVAPESERAKGGA